MPNYTSDNIEVATLPLFAVGDKVKIFDRLDVWEITERHLNEDLADPFDDYEGYVYHLQCGVISDLARETDLIMAVRKRIKKPILTKKDATKTKIALSVERTKGITYLDFDIAPEIEALWKERSKEVKESESWPELKFYSCPDIIEASYYQNLLSFDNLIDNYGHTVFVNRRFNIAFIRTVGGKGKVKIQNDISLAEVSDAVKRATHFLKTYFEEYTNDFVIRGVVNFEV